MSYFIGDVVWFNNPDFTEKHRPHIIVGKQDEVTYFVVCSTQIETTRKIVAYLEHKNTADSLDTLIVLPAGASRTLREPSAINCNKLTTLNIIEFTSQAGSNFKATNNDRINEEFLLKIKNAIYQSETISPDIKAIIK
jgi:hypothetical protein